MRDERTNLGQEIESISESRLASVLDTAVDGIVVTDERGRVLVYNKACERLFGYSAVEMIGENVVKIMPREYADRHDDYMHNYRTTGEKRIIGIGREVAGLHRDGTVIPVELSVGEAITPVGRQFIGILRDLRQRKAVEKRIDELQAQLVHLARISAMDEIGAAVAHELNQPLTAVMLYLQAVTRRLRTVAEETGVDADERAIDVLAKAVGEADRAGKIIQRMRQIVEKREPQRRAVRLEELIDEAIELTRLGRYAGEVEIRRSDEPDLPSVDVDPVQIQQVIANLVRNAIEAVRECDERWVRIGIRRVGERVEVEIADSGPGIPEGRRAELFKAFSTNKRSGLGLGLAISRTIAQNHGGDLTVDPGGNGQGARFLLLLPITGNDRSQGDEKTAE
ncbi:MAG: PAS domain-containing sensor histidine kinase [Hyphomicrobiales bacterium]|nr:MAG: PAS domain-containing sensor histidine kinase [Hyphomicrobiales bacterium]